VRRPSAVVAILRLARDGWKQIVPLSSSVLTERAVNPGTRQTLFCCARVTCHINVSLSPAHSSFFFRSLFALQVALGASHSARWRR
jgi:hypothetical protein